MKTCLLNLPYHEKIMRRYNCTYYAPNFLFPPLELMYLGAIITEWKKEDCILIDAIAERLTLKDVVSRLKGYQPDLLVFVSGIELFAQDMEKIAVIKSNLPFLKIACIGYLTSLFPKKTLEDNPAIDYIIIDEPEFTFSELYDCLKQKIIFNTVLGLAYRNNGRITLGSKRERIKDLDNLPFPNKSLINQRLYSEFMLEKPFITIQTSRGCPFECTFCVRTYGKKVIYRSVENIIAEIEEAVKKYGIKSIRFMDDTFTLDKNHSIELCTRILKRKLKFSWSCLSRVDMLDKEMILLMQKAGCKRIYLGIETSSQRILDFLKKGYEVSLIREQIKIIKKSGIETVGFFMVGGLQTETEFKNDINLAKETDLDYVVVEKITPYPGTPLFEYVKDTDFSQKALEWERIFYGEFYLRPKYIVGRIGCFIFNIKDLLVGMIRLVRFLSLRQSQPSRSDMI